MIANWVRISDYLWFQEGPGVRNYQYTDSGVKLLNVANFVNGALDISNTSRFISEEEAYGRYNHFLVDDGDFIIASSGIKVETFDEKMGFASADDLPLCMNTSTIRFKAIDPDKVDIRFFMYYLKSLSFKRQLSKQITGSAQLNFGPSHLKKMSFPLYGLDFQHEVALRLDKLQAAVDAQQHRLQQFETLVKSRFVEMFGTIDETPYEVVAIQDLCEPIKDGTHQTPTYADGPEDGVAFLSSKDVTTGKIDWSNIKYITPELHEELHRRIAPRKGDILLAKNGTTGVCAIVDSDRVFDLYVTLALLRPLEGINSSYLWAAVNSDRTKSQFDARLKGVGVPNLHLKEIKQTLVVKPPLALQQEFAAFVQQIDKSKVAVQKAIDKLELLKASLMQEYFG